MNKLLIAAAAAVLAVRSLRALPVHADLIYSGSCPARIYLNGVEIKNNDSAVEHFTDYALLSSDDGALPLSALKANGPNILAINQYNPFRSRAQEHMNFSWLLRVRMASGRELFFPGTPDSAKVTHLRVNVPPPAGWDGPSFNDAAWARPKTLVLFSKAGGTAMLKDPSDPSSNRHLPFLVHDSTGSGTGGEHVCYRHAFQLPLEPGAIRVHPYQPGGKKGDKVAFALIPDRGCVSAGDIEISAQLPAGLEPVLSPGSHWDRAKRSLSWAFPSAVKTLNLNLESVIENHGFALPAAALGPWKANRGIMDKRQMGDEFWKSADFVSGSSAWFKMSQPPFKDGPGAPVILGLTFQSQILPGGGDSSVDTTAEAERIMLNYSVDGSLNGALKDGVNLSKSGGPADAILAYWNNGFYDAARDRAWTWADLANLRVKLGSDMHGRRTRSSLLSCIVSVSYYQPGDALPRFYAGISEARCLDLPLRAAMRGLKNDAAGAGGLAYRVNPALCGGK